jgi:hypothetical protein
LAEKLVQGGGVLWQTEGDRIEGLGNKPTNKKGKKVRGVGSPVNKNTA